MTAVIIAVFCTWILVIFCVQFPGFPLRKSRYLGVLGHFIPAWHFFAPKPPQGDVIVLYRTIHQTDSVPQTTEWHVLEGWGSRRPTQLLIYPNRRAKHVLLHCCTRIIRLRRVPGSDLLKVIISAPYLLLLSYITAQVEDDAHVQFRIDFVSSYPNRSLTPESSASRTIFQSPLHRSSKPSPTKAGPR